MSKPQSILFVCLGNICRSPLSEEIAKHYAHKYALDLQIDSCGTGDWHVGEAPCADSIKIAQQHGLDISYQRSRTITPQDIQVYDLIIALDDNNLRDLKAMGAQNVKKLGSYAHHGEDVPDPYFFAGFEGFDKVYKMIDESVKALFAKELDTTI